METFSRRERQILDILYARGRATAAEIRADLPDPPSYSATRALLHVLEEKGHISHVADGPRYVFMPRVARERAAKSALRHLLHTFFDGSASHAVAALLDVSASKLTPEELDRLDTLVEHARQISAQNPAQERAEKEDES
jgi:BlaI family transcriptional regulator, penicillinase repressor